MSASYIHTKRNTRFSRIILKFFALLYFLGIIASIVYLWFFTENRFVSIAEFKVSKKEGAAMEGGLATLGISGLSDSGSLDSIVAIGYIDSVDLLLSLEKEFRLVEHYSSPTQDYFFRLDPKANLEERLKYYRNRIFAHFDLASGLTAISVDTFKPELSRDIAAALLKKSESFTNLVNQQIADQQLNFIRNEVERTASSVEAANKELMTLQNDHNFINPSEVISSSLRAVQEMRMQYLKSEAELSSILRDSPSSPRIDNIRSRLRSLKELIDSETATLSGPEKDRLNQLLIQFKQLELNVELRTRLRTSAELMFEKNRNEAVALSRFFTVIQNPYLPEDVSIPRRPYVTCTILVLGLLLFLILRALTHSIFERA